MAPATSTASHLAAILTAKGQPAEVQSRLTPKPGPSDLLVAVKAIALNPADYIIRDLGLFVPEYPTVIGFDLAGIVLAVGEDVPTGTQDGDHQAACFLSGSTRVAAYAAFAWKAHADCGAFQDMILVPWQHAIVLPDGDTHIPWTEAATLPVAVQVPLSMWDAMGIPRASTVGNSAHHVAQAQPRDGKTEALLVWGASSSVGSMGVQTARILRDDPASSVGAVYATASSANHAYVTSLGANRTFDYKGENVVQAIIDAAEQDGLVIQHCFLAMGELALCQGVLKAFATANDVASDTSISMIASAPPIPAKAADVIGVKTLFVQPSYDGAERLEQFHYWLGTFGTQGLAQKILRPSPQAIVVGKGLEAINVGLERLSQGVSCAKLVIELGE